MGIKNCGKLLAMGLAAALPLAAGAETTPSYTYVEGDYVRDNTQYTGGALVTSFAILPNLHVVGDAAVLEDRASGPATASLEEWRAGLGFNTPIRPGLDAVGRISVVHASLNYHANGTSGGEFGAGDTGFQIEGLLRFTPTDRLELDGGIAYNDYGSFNSSLGTFATVEGKAIFTVVPTVAIVAGINYKADGHAANFTSSSGGDTEGTIGVRWTPRWAGFTSGGSSSY